MPSLLDLMGDGRQPDPQIIWLYSMYGFIGDNQHFELHLEASPLEPNATCREIVLYGYNEKCQKPIPVHFGLTTASKYSSSATPCRTCDSNPLGDD